MQKIEVLVGCPASGKSTYSKNLMKREPGIWKKINNDLLREMIDSGVWSFENEQIIVNLRKDMIKTFLTKGFNIIVDNVNLNKNNFKDICEIAKASNKDIKIYEKHFYCELEELIERDSKRINSVGEKVIKDWWKKSGGKAFKTFQPKEKTYFKNNGLIIEPIKQDENLDKAIISDLDGTLAIMGNRSPYDASNCHLVDQPNEHVIETINLYKNAGYKIIFCSGRMEKDRAATIKFIDGCFDNLQYELFMRSDGDFSKDSIVKEKIYNEKIKNKYNIRLILDDRSQVVEQWRKLGLICFQVASGNF
jgi:predicted kinase